MSVALVHAADDHPAAVIDPAGERKLAGDAITAVDRRNASRRQIDAAMGRSRPSAHTACCASSAHWLM